MCNENEKPLGMSDEEWDELNKQAFFQQCPDEVKEIIRKQGINLTDEEHEQIWQDLPKYFAHLRKEHKKKKIITMFTPDGLNKISQCISIIKTIGTLINEDVKIELAPIETIYRANQTVSQLIIVVINEIKFGQEVVDGKCGNLLSQLNEIADVISLSTDYSGENISMHIYINDAVVVKEI